MVLFLIETRFDSTRNLSLCVTVSLFYPLREKGGHEQEWKRFRKSQLSMDVVVEFNLFFLLIFGPVALAPLIRAFFFRLSLGHSLATELLGVYD